MFEECYIEDQVLINFLCAFLLIITASNVLAEHKKTLHIGVSFSIPPWVIQEQNSGIELDILRTVLEKEHYIVQPHYIPFALAYQRFDAHQLDGVINAKAGVAKHGYLTNPVVTFQNVAISLNQKKLPLDISITDLVNKQVVAFQKASTLLGSEFSSMAEKNTDYLEVANQILQLNLLFIREVDFIVMDKSIFGYFWHKSQRSNPNDLNAEHLKLFKQPIRFHPMFAPSPYPFIFADKDVRDVFNRGLKELKESGQYAEIFKRYNHLTNLYDTSADAGQIPTQ